MTTPFDDPNLAPKESPFSNRPSGPRRAGNSLRYLLIVLALFVAGGGTYLGMRLSSRSSSVATPNRQAMNATANERAPRSTTSTIPVTTTTSAPPTITNSPVAVVEDYFAAINAHDYQTAWALGGVNLSSSYATFVQGFSTTANDKLTSISAQGNIVYVAFIATQTSGDQPSYGGNYTVSNGVIVAADVQHATTTPTGSSCQAGQLSASLVHNGAAAGTIGDIIELTNASSTTCTLDGYPGLALYNARGQATPATVEPSPVGGSSGPTPVTLAPGSSASFDLLFSNAVPPQTSCQPSTLGIIPPGSTGQVGLSASINPCASPGTPPRLTVSALVAGTSP